MSTFEQYIPNSSVIPAVESNIFSASPDSSFALAKIAVGGQALSQREQLYEASFWLRRSVYVEQTKQLDPSDLDEVGRDRDSDDERSVSFGILENKGVGRVALTGFYRLIGKGNDAGHEASGEEVLPVERFFPEVFKNAPAPKGSLEISRFISRHEDRHVQNALTRRAYFMIANYIAARELGPAYAVIEPGYERLMKMTGLSIKRIGEPVHVEKYKGVNIPIEADPHATIQQFGRGVDVPDSLSDVIYFDNEYTTVSQAVAVA